MNVKFDQEGRMPSSVWKGNISFGLVSVPIRIFVAARASHISFHEIHRTCGTRIREQLYCPHDERVVSRDEIVLGYETEKDQYVLVEPQELKNALPPSSTAMEILQFVKLSDVDPIYFETSYFAVPEEASQRAYTLLVKTMEGMKYAALAKVTLHQRERTVIIRPYEHGLTLHTIYYPNEIRMAKGYAKVTGGSPTKQEMALANQFASGLVKPFHAEQFVDEYQKRVKQLIESKSKGKSLSTAEKTKRRAPVIDLMAALKKSVESRGLKSRDSELKRPRKRA
jgi:DNA end-binding protein Ku